MKQLSIKTADGTAPAFEFGSGPSVLMFIDGIGMRPAMHEIGERLGKAGYRVLMPDLFYRIGPYEPIVPAQLMSDPAVRGAWFAKLRATPVASYLVDTRAYLEHLDGPVGTTGYCMGGRLSIVAAATYPERIVAAAAYHPGGLVSDGPDSPHLLVPNIKASVYVGGAMDDETFTAEHAATLEAALTAAHVDHVIEAYPAKHGWVPSDTVVHDPVQAERHWQTLLALFAKHLH